MSSGIITVIFKGSLVTSSSTSTAQHAKSPSAKGQDLQVEES